MRYITLPLALFLLLIQLPMKGSTAQSLSKECDPLGMVNSTNGSLKFGTGEALVNGDILCSGDQIVLANGSSIRILCFSRREVIDVNSETRPNRLLTVDPNLCAIAQSETRPCNQSICFTPRGGVTSSLEIIRPQSSRITEFKPTIAWNPVIDSTNYIVQVSSGDLVWQKTIVAPSASQPTPITLVYPVDKPPLIPYSACQVTVVARRDEEVLLIGERVFNVVPPQ